MKLPPKPSTINAINEIIEKNQDSKPRNYLGMSVIGEPCERKLWYSFRQAKVRHISAKGLKAIEDGHLGEELMAKRLRMVPGVTLHTVDEQGNQFSMSAIGGHFRGHMDGGILGILEAPKTWHVWEHKSVNEKKFEALKKTIEKHGEKDALEHWDEVYYGQAICYMEASGAIRHFLTCSTPGGRDFISVRTNANPKRAKQLLEKAERIIFSPEPPTRLSNDPAWYQCKWCDYQNLCHGTDTPDVNCRTCTHSSPVQEGRWSCALGESMKPGCAEHRYIPILLESFAEPTDGSQEGNWVMYRHKTTGNEFVNGSIPGGYSSQEIQLCEDKEMLGDDVVNSLKNEFDGQVVG